MCNDHFLHWEQLETRLKNFTFPPQFSYTFISSVAILLLRQNCIMNKFGLKWGRRKLKRETEKGEKLAKWTSHHKKNKSLYVAVGCSPEDRLPLLNTDDIQSEIQFELCLRPPKRSHIRHSTHYCKLPRIVFAFTQICSTLTYVGLEHIPPLMSGEQSEYGFIAVHQHDNTRKQHKAEYLHILHIFLLHILSPPVRICNNKPFLSLSTANIPMVYLLSYFPGSEAGRSHRPQNPSCKGSCEYLLLCDWTTAYGRRVGRSRAVQKPRCLLSASPTPFSVGRHHSLPWHPEHPDLTSVPPENYIISSYLLLGSPL